MTSRLNPVLVTGASRGIGRAVAGRLTHLGYPVFAGVRRPEDGDRLAAELGPGVTPLMLDVTQQGEIAAARKQVENETDSLAALVNNAGILVAGPLEIADLHEVRAQFEVNVVGALATSQAFLPLLRGARGRIVNVGSVAGTLSIPMLNPYSASKFALAAMTDSLRRELRGSAVGVSLIEAGAVGTELWETSFASADRRLAEAEPELRDLYAADYRRARRRYVQLQRAASTIDGVVDAVVHAVRARRPKPRYRVGRTSTAIRLLSLCPERVADRALRLFFFGSP